MKKLMIAAAAVAVGAGTYAANLDAQVYDFSMTMKTTTCKEVKYTKTIATLEGEDWDDVKKDKITVRKQASMKIVGVIWGCDCPTWVTPGWALYNGGSTVGGYLFWNQTTQTLLNPRRMRFDWAILNRIDDGKKVEGVWKLWNKKVNTMRLVGAGFGKVSGSLNTCLITLTSMSGSFAGYSIAGLADNCRFCGGNNACTAWQVCICALRNWHPSTAAYGSWKIKYNKSASKNLRKYGRLTESYKFKKAGKTQERLAWLEEHPEVLASTDEEDDAVSYGYDLEDDWEDVIDRVELDDDQIDVIGAVLLKGKEAVVTEDGEVEVPDDDEEEYEDPLADLS